MVVSSAGASAASPDFRAGWRALFAERRIERIALALGLCAVPLSIAVSETLLSVALVARLVNAARGRVRFSVPRIFWFWLAWALLLALAWLVAPDLKAGWGEIRRLLLIAALFFLLPALHRPSDRRLVWQGIFLTASLGSLFLIGDFLARLFQYRRELAVTADPSLYLRTGGLLNHWMVYGTVEILVVAGLLAFWRLYPESRRRWLPVFVLNALAVVLSLTRMAWVTCFVLLTIELAWRRSAWLLAVPVLPVVLYVLAPGAVRARLRESLRLSHYSNLERVQMMRVGLKIVRERPLTGVGPGRAGRLYRKYLEAKDPVPAWHGHLHNNAIQMAAEFGLPALTAALVFCVALFRGLIQSWKQAQERETQFGCRTALLALVGFLLAGLFDYAYGHSLALILLSFAVLSPLLPAAPSSS